jgi:hypothetical protein
MSPDFTDHLTVLLDPIDIVPARLATHKVINKLFPDLAALCEAGHEEHLTNVEERAVPVAAWDPTSKLT